MHTTTAGYIRQIKGVSNMLVRCIDELEGRLVEVPGPRLNPAGFIVWHLLRVWDHDLRDTRAAVAADDVWHRHGFTAETGYAPVIKVHDDGEAYADGYGYSRAEVAAVPYREDWLVRYHRLLLDETLERLADPELDCDAPIKLPERETPTTAGQTFDHLVIHSAYHIGELQLTMGLLGIPDPSTPEED